MVGEQWVQWLRACRSNRMPVADLQRQRRPAPCNACRKPPGHKHARRARTIGATRLVAAWPPLGSSVAPCLCSGKGEMQQDAAMRVL